MSFTKSRIRTRGILLGTALAVGGLFAAAAPAQAATNSITISGPSSAKTGTNVSFTVTLFCTAKQSTGSVELYLSGSTSSSATANLTALTYSYKSALMVHSYTGTLTRQFAKIGTYVLQARSTGTNNCDVQAAKDPVTVVVSLGISSPITTTTTTLKTTTTTAKPSISTFKSTTTTAKKSPSSTLFPSTTSKSSSVTTTAGSPDSTTTANSAAGGSTKTTVASQGGGSTTDSTVATEDTTATDDTAVTDDMVTTGAAESSSDDDGGSSAGVIGGGIAIAALLGLFLVLAKKRKKKEEAGS